MKKYIDVDVYVSVFIILLSVYVFVDARNFPEDCGIAPMLCSVLLVIGSLFILFKGLQKTKDFRSNATEEMMAEKKKASKELGVSFVSLAFCGVYVLLIPHLGFFVSTTVFLISYMLYLNIRNYAAMLLITVSFEFVLYILFVTQLNVRLPKGFLI
jgi:hypothetical protein